MTSVRPYDSIPDIQGYQLAVLNAVEEFDRRTQKSILANITLVVGQTSYSLPQETKGIISVKTPFAATPQPLSTSRWNEKYIFTDRIIPVPFDFDIPTWSFTVSPPAIVFDTAPVFGATIKVIYKSGIYIDPSNAIFCDSEQKNIFMIKARSLVLQSQASNTASDSWVYTLTLETADKRAQASSIRAQSQELQKEFDAQVKSYNGFVVRSTLS